MKTTLAIPLLLLFVACGRPAIDVDAEPEASPEERAVEELFQRYRDGEFESAAGLDSGLGWEHVPALIELGASEQVLTRFPVDPFSSFGQSACSEGVLALWLVEALRRDRPMGYPSLNPKCLSSSPGAPRWNARTADNRPALHDAYRSWWDRVGDEPLGVAKAADPLEGTGLHWF